MSEHWIQTYSTKSYDFYENNPSDVDIVDIANSLAQIPRFNGHLKRSLSVAQHSLTLAAVLRKEGENKYVALQGLMHDAHEAYTGDITRPMKLFLLSKFQMDWDAVELPVKRAITEKFGIDIVDYPDVIDNYDDACLATEAECLFERPLNNWTDDIPYRLKDRITEVLSVREAKSLFLDTFERLGGRDRK